MTKKDYKNSVLADELKWLYREAPVDFVGTGTNDRWSSKCEKEWRTRFEDVIKQFDDTYRGE